MYYYLLTYICDITVNKLENTHFIDSLIQIYSEILFEQTLTKATKVNLLACCPFRMYFLYVT